MNIEDLVTPEALKQPVYEPGKPIADVARDFGLDAQAILKLASNENPLGPSPLAVEAAQAAATQAHLYPDGACTQLREKLASRLGLNGGQIIFGNGSNEIFELLGHAFLHKGCECVMGAQAFIVYKLVTLLFGAKVVEVPMPDYRHDLQAIANAVTDQTRLVFLPSPNNPTATANTQAEIETLVRSLPEHVIFVYDEAYAEYEDSPPDLRRLIAEGRKIICTRTFSKIYGLAAFRIGYAYASAEMIAALQRVRQPFNVNGIAQAAAYAALEDDAFVAESRAVNQTGRAQLLEGFEKLGLEAVGEAGNFVLVKTGSGAAHFAQLQKEGVIVRPLVGYGLPEHLRVTIGTPAQNKKALEVFAQL